MRTVAFTTCYGHTCQHKADRPGIAKLATGNKFLRLDFTQMKNEKLFVSEGFHPQLRPWANSYAEVFAHRVAKRAHYKLAQEPLKAAPSYWQKIKQPREQTFGLKLNHQTS